MSEVGFGVNRWLKDRNKDAAPPSQNQVSPSHDYSEFSHLLVFRYTLFLAMEAAFTGLAWHCYRRPRALPAYIDFDLRTVKSGFITIFNLWHTVAIACAVSICAEAFSKEWAAREERTDIVSTVSSGIIDRLHFSFTRRATKTFKAAFVIALGLIVMRTAGSSTVTATDGIPSESSLPIGLISTTSLTPDTTDTNSTTFLVRLAQANMAVRLEHLIGAPWGYVPQPNWIIPLPTQDLNMTNRVAYETDLVRFNYTCQWKAPDSFLSNTVTTGSETWTGRFNSNATRRIEEGFTGATNIRNGSTILQLSPTKRATGVSAYLILGGNSTVFLNSTSPGQAQINLTDLPTTFNPDGFLSFGGRTLRVRAQLATVLVCDPQLHFTAGTVLLSPSSNRTEPDITVQEENSNSRMKNIDQTAAQTLFTSSLSFAINEPDSLPGVRLIDFLNFNSVGAMMLLKLPPFPLDWESIGHISPLDIPTINDNLNSYTLSAMKAFTSGYKGEANIQQVAGVFATVVNAEYTSARLALTTSIQFAIVHTVLFALTTTGLAALAYLNHTQGRKPFNLKVVRSMYGRHSTDDQMSHSQ